MKRRDPAPVQPVVSTPASGSTHPSAFETGIAPRTHAQGRDDHDALVEHLSARHEPCPGCGFDLFGLHETRCPECGMQVCVGVVPVVPPGRALWLLLAPLLATSVFGLFGAFFSRVVRNDPDDWIIGLVIALAACLLAIVGYWRRRTLLLIFSPAPMRALAIVLWIISPLLLVASMFVDI